MSAQLIQFQLAVLCAGALVLSGCGQEEVRVYRTPKEPAERAPARTEAEHGSQPVIENTRAADEPTWNVPQSWRERPATVMVLKNFSVADDDGHEALISVSAFPGDVGGPLANVNRWRAQLGLPAVTAGELPQVTSALDVNGVEAMLVDITGADGRTGRKARMIVATVPRGGETWFYKLAGDECVVGREKEEFVQFVQSVRYRND